VTFHLRRRAFGKPDRWFIRLCCWALGHDELPCEPECCNGVWCERCLARLRDLPPASATGADAPSKDTPFAGWVTGNEPTNPPSVLDGRAISQQNLE
jgi:hypothetical protein